MSASPSPLPAWPTTEVLCRGEMSGSLSSFELSVPPSFPAELGVAKVSDPGGVWLGAGRRRRGHRFPGGAVLSHADPSASGFAASLPQGISSLEPLGPDSDGPLAEFGQPRACTLCLWNDVRTFWGRILPPFLPVCLGGS